MPERRNPFDVQLNGRIPQHDLHRVAAEKELSRFVSELAHGAFTSGIILGGTRGTGKTLELRRLSDTLLAKGVVPLRVSGAASDDRSLSAAIVDALDAATGARPTGGKETKLSATGRVPFVGIEVAAERTTRPQPESVRTRLLRVVAATSERARAVAVLIDEAEQFESSDWRDALFTSLEQASYEGLPLSVVIVLTDPDRAWWHFAQQSTNSPDLFERLWLERFEPDDIAAALTETASHGGQDWSELPLDAIVHLIHGIPRRLMWAGKRLFDAFDPAADPVALVNGIAVTMASSLQDAGRALIHDPIQREVYEHRASIDGLKDAQRSIYLWAQVNSIPAVEAARAFDSLVATGLVEHGRRGTFVTPPRPWH